MLGVCNSLRHKQQPVACVCGGAGGGRGGGGRLLECERRVCQAESQALQFWYSGGVCLLRRRSLGLVV
jgi:hypothetical protein